jgi:hypothetical protein
MFSTFVTNTVQDTEKYRRQWTAQVDRIKDNTVPKTVIQYRPQGRRNVERPNTDSTEKESFLACHIYFVSYYTDKSE